MASKSVWGGRLPGGLNPTAFKLLHSLEHDRFLWPYDILGTMAHVHTLAGAGVVTKTEAGKLLSTLADIHGSPDLIEDTDEDVHSAIERVLTQRLGSVGAKVHAGRSRNDQVATAMRLWARESAAALLAATARLVSTLSQLATGHQSSLMPGYTHLQRAQPITLGHWALAHATALDRDTHRIRAAYDSADVSPLGAGALATNTFGLDATVAMSLLGFSGTFTNSMDAVGSRDYLADLAYATASVAGQLSRIGSEIVLWSTTEFGYLKLADEWSTGSSMMPQKKNPDVGEFVRGLATHAQAALAATLGMSASLPWAYNRDLQVDKQVLVGVPESVAVAAESVAGLLDASTFDTSRMLEAASDDVLLATDLAEAMVKRGVPFREAHERTAALVRDAIQAGQTLREFTDANPSALAPLKPSEIPGLLDPAESLKRRTSPAGPNPKSVARTSAKLARSAQKTVDSTNALTGRFPSLKDLRRLR